ncbi:MAG: CocE/NonD family hydrolase [Candidatus Aminicenantes bacterium]|nr:CocE/NonD family hydrolase [Candidatus Aminicenantes bacterium]
MSRKQLYLSALCKAWIPLLALIFVLAALFVNPGLLSCQEQEKISSFGKYKGYSEEKYDSFVRSSQYISMRDGTKIAIDIIRPVKDDHPMEDPLPVVWTHTRYRRASLDQEGEVHSSAGSSYLRPLLKHGYITAAADVRGSGASFGTWPGIFTKEETQDAYEITEWLASQPWCDGNVGMFGGSYLGITQLMAASTKPPHLKAIFPMVALFDLYEIGSPGGVLRDDFLRTWSELTQMLDTQPGVMHVDEDPEGKMLEQALQEHQANRSLVEIMAELKYRDDQDPVTGAYPFREWHPAGFIQQINASGIPMYIWGGWFDSFTKDTFLIYKNFTTPRKLLVGAWSHSPRDEEIRDSEFNLIAVEQLRWFDYWLKGIDNGIMEEPPIRYELIEEPGQNQWRTAQVWPLPQTRSVHYYFSEGPSGSVESINDGILNTKAPQSESASDPYPVDYSTTTGTATRWDNAVGGEFDYPDMTTNDQKGLTYTTPPLEEDIQITGHPVVRIWLSSSSEDGNIFVYLEEVDEEGFSHYFTEGVLRLSHRAQHEPAYDNFGLPYHRSFQEDVEPMIPGKPFELVFDMQPTANVFDAGHRIRVTLTGADADNAKSQALDPPPTYVLHRSVDKPSHIQLPIFQEQTKMPEGQGISLVLVLVIALVIIILVLVFTNFMRSKSQP